MGLDNFTLVLFLLMIMITINQGVVWAGAGLLLLMVFSLKSKSLIIITVLGIIAGVMFEATTQALWIVMAIVGIGILLFHQGGTQSYGPETLFGG